jgi:hypothetical protein
LRKTHLSCEQRICVAINANTIATNAFAVRKTQNGCRRPKIARARRKIAADDAKRLLADFFALVSNANALQTLQTESLRTYRSAKLYKQTANALIAVQNDTNGLQMHSSQFKMTQTDCKRTRRSRDWIER